jgi:hypothetical protein
MQFELDLNIDADSLKTINGAGLQVILAKTSGSKSSPTVSWVAFTPFEANAITWVETYGIYASSSTVQKGVVIQKMSDVFPAQDGASYTFDQSATFSGPDTSGSVPLGSFNTINQMPPVNSSLTFGLEQSAIVRGVAIQPAPLNAQSLPSGMNATFTPLTTVWVWLQANTASSTMLTEVIGAATAVTFGEGVEQQTLVYNPKSTAFEPSNSKGQLLAPGSAPHVKLYIPAVI